MSQAEKINDLKIEVQKLLGEISRDMTKLKNEVASLSHIVEGDASLSMNSKLVNERLMVLAKEAGIDLDDLEIETSNQENSEQNGSEENGSEHDSSQRENGTQESPGDNEQTTSTSNAAALAALSNKVTKIAKQVLK